MKLSTKHIAKNISFLIGEWFSRSNNFLTVNKLKLYEGNLSWMLHIHCIKYSMEHPIEVISCNKKSNHLQQGNKPLIKTIRILCGWEFQEDRNGSWNIKKVSATGPTKQDLYRLFTCLGLLTFRAVVSKNFLVFFPGPPPVVMYFLWKKKKRG